MSGYSSIALCQKVVISCSTLYHVEKLQNKYLNNLIKSVTMYTGVHTSNWVTLLSPYLAICFTSQLFKCRSVLCFTALVFLKYFCCWWRVLCV